jgi:hypothetical protein
VELRHAISHPHLPEARTRTARHPRRLRLEARVRSWRLDHALAAGAEPRTSALLSCRAAQLTSSDYRDRLAEALRDSLTRSTLGGSYGAGAPLASACIRANSGTLLALASRLASDRRVDAAGVARTRLLLVDACSPLYEPATTLELEDALESALIGLDG